MLFSLGPEAEWAECRESGPPSGRKQQAAGECACKLAFGSSRGGLPAGKDQFCTEAPQARGRALHDPCPGQPCPYIPGLQRYCPRKRQAAGSMSDMPGRLPRVSPIRAFPLGLGLMEDYSQGWCGQGVSPHCQGLEVGGLWQREWGCMWADAQALSRPTASAQQGEKEAHCAPKLALPLHTQAVLPREPRSCLTGSGSPNPSEGAGGRNRCVHVILPWPWNLGPLAGPQAKGQGP